MYYEQKSIYELWEMLISRKKAGTARSYQDAFNRFKKDNGSHITFSDITPEFIDQWRKIMLLSVSRTTTNIYLRSFSAVLHIAYEYQLISEPPKFLFRGLGIFSSHGSNSRRHWYLPASDWHKMWVFFETQGRGNPICRKWRKDYRERYFEAVGLMLFMYLGNGMNLRDLCMLRYNKFYFQSGTLFPQSRSLFVLLLFSSTFPFSIYAYIAIFVLSRHTFPLPNEGVHPRLALPKKARLRTVDF